MRILVAVVAAALAPMAAPTGAPVSGYWWAGETGVVSAPAPPQVPAGGLYVASAPSGATAVSAVGISLPADHANPQLVLKVHQLQQADGVLIDAYPTTST